MKKNIGTKKVALGTLYDFNRDLIKTMKNLSAEELQNKKDVIDSFIKNTNNQYYMLLCKEKSDYTIFRLCDSKEKLTDVLVDECLFNRGNIKVIDITAKNDAIEIWIEQEKEMFCYYFFPYDNAVIECY